MHNLFSIPQRFSAKEQTLFAKRLSFLVGAGVPLVESLGVVHDQMRTKGHQAMLASIVHDVSNGQQLSRSFTKFPHVFNEFSIQIVKVGEASGTLSHSLAYLADELQKRQALRSKVVGALIYPALITCATAGITIFLVVYLFPKIVPVFSSMHVQLPLTTRIMLALSTLVCHDGVFLLCGAIGLGVLGTVILRKSSRARTLRDRAIIHAPLVGSMIRSYNVANACRTLGLLLKSGLRLSDALVVTADTTPNRVYKQAYRELGSAIERGECMSTYVRRRLDLFPDVLGQMLAVGERSGTLSDTLVYLSNMYESEVDDFTKNLSTLMEPALMLVMGLVVGFIAISIITPIYGITQNLHT